MQPIYFEIKPPPGQGLHFDVADAAWLCDLARRVIETDPPLTMPGYWEAWTLLAARLRHFRHLPDEFYDVFYQTDSALYSGSAVRVATRREGT